MLSFEELPTDIVPLILQHIIRPQHLAAASLVCKLFNDAATPLLYHEVSIFTWHRDPKAKAMRLLTTLGSSPHLAKHVHKVVIRDFHKIRYSNREVLNTAVSAISNLSNLRSCVWTRDGTMKGPILDALNTYCPKLRELEINGRHQWNYEPEQLTNLRGLESIALLMPNGEVVSALVNWCEAYGDQLKELTLICKSTPVINDDILRRIATNTRFLRMLRLAGCPKVTHHGVSAILQSCANKTSGGLEDLRLEGVSNALDLNALSSNAHSTLATLHAFTLTFTSASNVTSTSNSFLHLQDLLTTSPIRSLNLYLTGSAKLPTRFPARQASSLPPIQAQTRLVQTQPSPLATFLNGFVSIHCSTLTRVAILRIPIPLPCIKNICESCHLLEELFVVVDIMELRDFAKTTALANSLRSLHVNVPAEKWGYIFARGLPGSSWLPQPANTNVDNSAAFPSSIASSGTLAATNALATWSTPNASVDLTSLRDPNSDSEDSVDHDSEIASGPELDSEDEFGFNTMLHNAAHWNDHVQNGATTSTQATQPYTRVNRIESLLDALGVPAQLGPRVTQFGLMTRVWGVEYASKVMPTGDVEVIRRLAPYESPRVPDAFLVMMT